MLGSLANSLGSTEGASPLLAGGKAGHPSYCCDDFDRGLCGAFNSSIVREARRLVSELHANGKNVKILCVGRKGWAQLRRDYEEIIVDLIEDVGRRRIGFDDAQGIATKVLKMFEVMSLMFARWFTTLLNLQFRRLSTRQQLIPFAVEVNELSAKAEKEPSALVYDYEPDEGEILDVLLPAQFERSNISIDP